MKAASSNNGHGRSSGWTLPELMVAIAIGALMLTAIFGFSLYSLRSFVAIANYSELEEKSRRTLDEMTRQIRQATAIINMQNSGGTRWLTLTNSTPGAVNKYVKYTWDSSVKVLYFEATTHPKTPTLTECDNWEFSFYQRAPIPGSTNNQFFPAVDKSGKIDFTIAKLVDMKWHCTREVLGKTMQTESVQTTRIVLRNRQ